MLKYLLISLLIAVISPFSQQAQNVPVPQTSVPVIMKTSASWCSLCGGYGWNFFQQLLDDHQDQAVIFTGHISGDFNSAAATQIGANFGVYGHPTFLLNGMNKGVSSGNTTAKRAEIATDVQNIISTSPSLQLGIDATYSGNQLVVSYSLKAFSSLTGDYHVAFYLAEKEKVGQQTPIGSQAVHKKMLRHELNGNTFGPKIFSGTTPAGTVYDGSFSVALGDYTATNIDVIGIIWKATDSNFLIANANVDKSVQQSTGVFGPELSEANFRVYPTVIKETALVEVFVDTPTADAEIFITDITGKQQAGIFRGSLPSGTHDFQIQRDALDIPGIYIVVFRSGKSVKSAKLIME
jgi:hypothetical protein